MTLLSVEHVNKSYVSGKTRVQILTDINLQFEKGEFVSILGESGGGKSTLLNIIAGLDQDYQGTVKYRGQVINQQKAASLERYRRDQIGFVFQSFNLISHLTVLDNVILPLKMGQMTAKEQRQKGLSLLTKLGVEAQANKYPNQLSGGQKQRVAIARALAGDPEIIIADEPTGALDQDNTKAVLEILHTIAAEGKLVIQVTHSLTAARAGSRIVHLANGTISDQTNPKISADQVATQITQSKQPRRALGFINAFSLAMKHLRYHLKRNTFIVSGFAIGIFAVVIMLFLGNGIKGYMQQQINQQLNPRSFMVTQKSSGLIPDVTKVSVNGSDISRVRKIKGVKNIQPVYLAAQGQIQRGKKSAVEQYFATKSAAILNKNLIRGHDPKAGAQQVTLSKASAKALRKNWHSLIGQRVMLHFQIIRDGQPIPLSGQFTVVGLTSSTSSYTDYKSMDNLFTKNQQTLKPTAMAVTTNTLNQVKPIQTKIRKLANADKHKSYMVLGASSILGTLMRYVTLASYVLAAIAGISLLVSAFMIVVVMFISVTERTKEIGVLRALGTTKGDIRDLFLSEAMVLGGVSGLTGIVVAQLVSWGINLMTNAAIHYSILQASGLTAILIFLLSLIIGIFAALSPARQAAKLDPVRALATE